MLQHRLYKGGDEALCMLALIAVTGVHTSLLVLLELIRAKVAWAEIQFLTLLL